MSKFLDSNKKLTSDSVTVLSHKGHRFPAIIINQGQIQSSTTTFQHCTFYTSGSIGTQTCNEYGFVETSKICDVNIPEWDELINQTIKK